MLRILKREIKILFKDFFINGITASNLIPKPLRLLMYKIYGIKTKSLGIRGGCYFATPRITIGKNTFINNDVFLNQLLR